MRILHTNFHKGWGGQSNRILTECRGLAARGHEVALAVPHGSELAGRAQTAGLEVFDAVRFARGFRPHFLLPDILHLRELVRRRRFDVVHTHGSQDSWAIAFALLGVHPRPVVLRTKHNEFPVRDHFMNRWLYGKATDGLVCISQAILEYCAAKPYLAIENLHLVHSAVDSSRFGTAAPNPSIRDEYSLQKKYVACVTGRLRAEKGHRYLIEALPEIAKAAPDFALLIAGAGSLEDELKALARSLEVESHAIFTGFRMDVPAILAASDLFIMPSISEGLGTAIIEAACAGKPIVASDTGGIPDIVRSGESGLLVPTKDPAALAQAVLTFYRDRPLAARCAAAAQAWARTQFSEETLTEKTEAVYLAWLKRKARG